MTGEATSSYKWHVLEGPHLTLSSKKAASVAVLSLRAAAFMTQGTMSNWYMSPEGHGLRVWWSFYFQDSPMSGEWIPPWWCTAQSQFLAGEPMDNLQPMMTGSPETPWKEVYKMSAVKDFLRALTGIPVDFNLNRFQGLWLEGVQSRWTELHVTA